MHKGFLKIGFLLGAATVLLGAFGAHGLKKIVNPEHLVIYQTGVTYQFYHTFVLLIAGIVYKEFAHQRIVWACRFFIAGIILFSGSLYTIALMPALSFLGLITPVGGLFFVVGWILMLLSLGKNNQ